MVVFLFYLRESLRKYWVNILIYLSWKDGSLFTRLLLLVVILSDDA